MQTNIVGEIENAVTVYTQRRKLWIFARSQIVWMGLVYESVVCFVSVRTGLSLNEWMNEWIVDCFLHHIHNSSVSLNTAVEYVPMSVRCIQRYTVIDQSFSRVCNMVRSGQTFALMIMSVALKCEIGKCGTDLSFSENVFVCSIYNGRQ